MTGLAVGTGRGCGNSDNGDDGNGNGGGNDESCDGGSHGGDSNGSSVSGGDGKGGGRTGMAVLLLLLVTVAMGRWQC